MSKFLENVFTVSDYFKKLTPQSKVNLLVHDLVDP